DHRVHSAGVRATRPTEEPATLRRAGRGRRRGDLRSSRARVQLRGDAAFTSRAWSEDAGAAAAPPSRPPTEHRPHTHSHATAPPVAPASLASPSTRTTSPRPT